MVDTNHNCCVDELGELIQNMVRTLQIFERGKLSRHGFTMSQCYTLFNVQQHAALTMNQLSEKMNLDTSTMTRIVSTLVRDGYLVRERSPEDRRVIHVRLTETGKEAVGELSQAVREYYSLIIQAIPQGEVESVLKSVNTLLMAFEKVKPFCC
ncbi:MAG: MarR family transcriptional regulator [Firmicutes bacterium]|nr:MarR family transcriptional regulator [Bacillota bacterium]